MEISANIVHLWDSCRNKRDQICPKITKKRALLKTHLCDSNQSLIFLVLPRKFYGEGSLWPGRSCRSYDIYCKYLNSHIFFVVCVCRLIGMMSFPFSVSFSDCGEPIPTGKPVLDQWVRFHSTTSEYIAVIVYRISYKTSQELQMLPRSLSVCQSTIKNASKGLTIVFTSV